MVKTRGLDVSYMSATNGADCFRRYLRNVGKKECERVAEIEHGAGHFGVATKLLAEVHEREPDQRVIPSDSSHAVLHWANTVTQLSAKRQPRLEQIFLA